MQQKNNPRKTILTLLTVLTVLVVLVQVTKDKNQTENSSKFQTKKSKSKNHGH